MEYNLYFCTPNRLANSSAAKTFNTHRLMHDYQLLVFQEGEISTSLLVSMYTSEILGRGNQPQGWESPSKLFPDTVAGH
jgi:hypothetical protein